MRVEGLKTLFIDIDGSLLHHHGYPGEQSIRPTIVLPGVIKKLAEWETKGYKFILVTGRKESEREGTVKQLAATGIQYDQLIMGINRGDRVIINDMKPDSDIPTAVAINLVRNTGIENVEL